jgi:hypothetical protein
MRLTTIAASVLLTVTIAAEAGEGDWSANRYLPGCRAFLRDPPSGAAMVEMGRCVGFIEGVLAGDMIEARLYGVVSDKRLICMPPAVTVDQSIRVVVAFADHRPAENSQSLRRVHSCRST